MQRKIITTSDGSKTIHIVDWNEQYHSKHGAIQEAYHVFIKSGLSLFKDRSLSILEIGFGTGLNCLITLLEARRFNLNIKYVGLEAYPITSEELEQLNYISELKAESFSEEFQLMHKSPWEKETEIHKTFYLQKEQKDFKDLRDVNAHNLIYFDAFGARVQPELWTEAIFLRMYTSLQNEGVLVTYAAKGSVRRAMQAVGFIVERLPGPPGKREMLRATKRE
ncbi:MAG: tRNA (5-methylaminomethyl-2-thiouridine)(34)-methyltransferase MnmD [Maribacter sp.]